MKKHNNSKLPIILLVIALICIGGSNIILSSEYCDIIMKNKTILEVSFSIVVYLLLWTSLYFEKRNLLQQKYSNKKVLLLINILLYITPFFAAYTQIKKFL